VLKIFGTLIASLVVWAGFLLLFQNGIIPVDKVGTTAMTAWLSKSFIPSSLIVIFVTLVASGIWFWISWKQRESADCHESVKYW
jgi:heme/copper-type cytochrome/quinol oxidase subunit 2